MVSCKIFYNLSYVYISLFFILLVCSTTLWVGHLSKLVQQEELSDTFGKYGDIVSIDMIHPRGCAFIVMNRRQDSFKAMNCLKNFKMQGRAITISWAAGKGVKSKEWKDYWDLDLGVSYIPWDKISKATDLEALEEGGMFDEDSMPQWMKDKINLVLIKKKEEKESSSKNSSGLIGISGVDTSQPPPNAANTMIPGVQMVQPFPMGHVPRFMPPPMMGMVPGIPLGVPPPQMLMGMHPGMGGPPPPIDKSIPPPSISSNNSQNNNPFLSNVQLTGFPPVPPLPLPPPVPPPTGIINDDHMDIEMEDEDKTNDNNFHLGMFNRPPPIPPLFNNNDIQDRNRERSREQSREREREFRRRDQDDDRRDFRNDRRWNEKERSRERDIRDRDHGYRSNRSRDRNSSDAFDREKNVMGGGIQERLREIAGDPELLRRGEPPSLLDLPVKDQSKLPSQIWNSGPMQQGGPRNNFMDGRRNIDDLRGGPPHNAMGNGPPQRIRNDDRDIFNSMRRGGGKEGIYYFFVI